MLLCLCQGSPTMPFLMFIRNFLCNNLKLQRNHQNQLVTDYFQFSYIYSFNFLILRATDKDLLHLQH